MSTAFCFLILSSHKLFDLLLRLNVTALGCKWVYLCFFLNSQIELGRIKDCLTRLFFDPHNKVKSSSL